MAEAKAKIRYIATTRGAIASMRQWIQQATSGLNRVAGSTKKAGAEGKGAATGFEKWGPAIRTAGLGLVGFLGTAQAVRSVVGLVRKEFDSMIDRNKTAAEKAIEFGDAVQSLSIKLPSSSDMSLREIVEIAKGSRDPTGFLGAAQTSISAGIGPEVGSRVRAAVELEKQMGFLLKKDQPGFAKIAGSLVGLRNVFPGNMEEMLATMISAQTASFITEEGQFGQHAVPAVGRVAGQFKDTPKTPELMRELFARFAAIGTRIQDRDGQITATALVNFFRDINSSVAGVGRPDLTGLKAEAFVVNDPRFVKTQKDRLTATRIRENLRGELELEAQKELTDEELKNVAAARKGSIEAKGRLTGRAASFVAAFELLEKRFTDEGRPRQFERGHAVTELRNALKDILIGPAAVAEAHRKQREGFAAAPLGRSAELAQRTQARLALEESAGTQGLARDERNRLARQLGLSATIADLHTLTDDLGTFVGGKRDPLARRKEFIDSLEFFRKKLVFGTGRTVHELPFQRRREAEIIAAGEERGLRLQALIERIEEEQALLRLLIENRRGVQRVEVQHDQPVGEPAGPIFSTTGAPPPPPLR